MVFTTRLILISFILSSLGYSGGMYFVSYKKSEDSKKLLAIVGQLEKNKQLVTYYDEVLTMSARTAVLSGDEKWVERYYQFVPRLETSLEVLNKLGPSSIFMDGNKATENANIALIAMEEESFSLMKEGKLREAKALLFSEEYEKQKAIYTEGNEQVQSEINHYILELDGQLEKNKVVEAIAFWVMTSALLSIWIFLFYRFKSLTDQLRKNEARELEQATNMALLGEVAAGIGHDIKTPLAIIDAQISVLQDPTKSERHKKAMQRISKSIDLSVKMISNLESLARDEGDLGLQEVLLKDMLTEALQFSEKRLRFNGLDSEKDVKFVFPEDMKLSVERNKLVQVFINLIHNAADAVMKSENKWIQVEAIQVADKHVISFTDSGPGIPNDIAERIFETRYTTKQKGQGTGLGLSLSRKIIRKMQGDLYLDQNSTFTKFVIEVRAFDQRDQKSKSSEQKKGA